MRARFWTSSRTRLALLLLLSLAIHMLVLRLSEHSLARDQDGPGRIEATLVPLPPATPEAKPAEPLKPQRHLHHETPTPARAKPPPDPTPVPPATAPRVETSVTGPPNPNPDGSATGAENTAPIEPPASGPTSSPAIASPPPGRPARAPQSAILYYDVLGKDPKKDPNQSYVGNGILRWRLDGSQHYQADLTATASLLFLSFTVLESHSEGNIGGGGLEPSRYSETPRNREALVTLFRRGQDSVGVQSGAIDETGQGVQDRLSIVFQLGALLIANPDLGQAGAQWDVPVANLKGEPGTWTFRTVGFEPVNSGIGTIDATHVQRVLRPGTNDRRIDLWIALDLGGYPARILYTEPSSAYVDLTLTKIE